ARGNAYAKRSRSLSARLLHKVKERVLKWYPDQGYSFANVVSFGNLNSKELIFEVMEGDITQLVIQFQDKLGNVVEGHVLNIKVVHEAVRNIHSLGLFSNIEIMPIPNKKREGGVIVEVKLQEADQKSVEGSADRSIVPDPGGYPSLASSQPSGTISFEHPNIKGLNRSLIGSIATSNFLNPEDDLSFKLKYVHPYLDGVSNPRNRTFKTSIFNSSKLSSVLTGGPGFEEAVAPILMDRAAINVNGPPTTLSGMGIDRVAFLQGNITQDNTKFVNGAIVGERKIIQVDQCLGDLPGYDAFSLGRPNYVRYTKGELGAARNIVELKVGAELRVNVKNTQGYAFAEHVNDLGSSKDMKGNPTAAFRREGHGSSYGVGMKHG
ncbi:hypothetical protein ISN44_As01g034760, partial [Arabidopsis suecica]